MLSTVNRSVNFKCMKFAVENFKVHRNKQYAETNAIINTFEISSLVGYARCCNSEANPNRLAKLFLFSYDNFVINKA